MANAEAKLCALPAHMLAAQAATALKRFCSEHRDDLDRAGKAIGQENLSENFDTLLREAQAASSVGGKLTIFARSLWGLSPRNIVLYLGTIAFLGGILASSAFRSGRYRLDPGNGRACACGFGCRNPCAGEKLVSHSATVRGCDQSRR